MNRNQIESLVNKGYDLDLIAKTQPQGNVHFSSRYMQTGTGLVACVHTYRYPAVGLGNFWLTELMNDPNTIDIVSIGTEDKREIKKALSKSIGELGSRRGAKEKYENNQEYGDTREDQADLLKRMKRFNEVVKRLYFRRYIFAPTKNELDKKISSIIEGTSSFDSGVFLGEQKEEYKSIFQPAMKQVNLANERIGTPISAYDLSGSYFFNHVFLSDPNGSYMGLSETGGPILLDLFHRSEKRTNTNSIVAGNSGTGKSSFLKMIIDDMFARGNFVRIFDVSNEYRRQTEHQGGIVLTLDGTENRINPFQVFPTVTDEDSNIDEIGSFSQHVQKIKNIFSFMNKESTDDDRNLLDQIVVDFYIHLGMWNRNPKENMDKLHVIGLKAEQYPTLSRFTVYLNQVQRLFEDSNKSQMELRSITRIVQTFTTLQKNESDLFDGKTTIEDFEEQQLVTFDISGLKNHGMGVFNAQIYSVLSLISSHIIRNGRKYRNEMYHNQILSEDVPRYYLNIDEAQNLITPEFRQGVNTIASLMELMRKNFCGITLSFPTIVDFLPDPNERLLKTNEEYTKAVKKIFNLTQYRAFFNLPESDLSSLALALGQGVTKNELQQITQLEKKQLIFNIQGDRNIKFTLAELSDEEKARYGGGE